MDRSKLQERLLHTCAWCTEAIPEGSEVFGIGAHSADKGKLVGKEGQFIALSLALQEKTIVALVPTQGSEASRAGYDLVFIACSQDCAKALKEALQLEKDVFEDYA